MPIIWAFEHAAEADRKLLEYLLGKKDLTEEQTDKVRRIMVRSGSIEYGKSKAREYCKEGLELLCSFQDSPQRRMLEFATTWTQRNKYYNSLKRYE
jgi:geranylgeranyl pyrophosphate synthase